MTLNRIASQNAGILSFPKIFILISLAIGCSNHTPPTPLITGKAISPDLTQPIQNVGSMPVNVILNPDGKYAISTDAGSRQSLWCVRTSDGVGVSHLDFPKKTDAALKNNGLYYGLTFGPDNTLYAAQGGADRIAIVKIKEDGTLYHWDHINTRKADFPAGIAIDSRGYLYVANNDPAADARAFSVPGSVAIYDTSDGQEYGRYDFAESQGGSPNFPLAVAVLADGSKLYVSSERDAAVYVFNTKNPARPTLIKTLNTGAHPMSLLLNKKQDKLFVANAGSDTISVVDTAADQITSTILLRPDIARSLAGATPTGMGLSPTEKFLYVTLGDMNAVAVVDVPDKELEGYIPAGWYPTSVVVSPDGKRLLVSNAKGTTLRNPNPQYGSSVPGAGQNQYINNRLEGNVISIAVPDKGKLKELTQQVLVNNRIAAAPPSQSNPLRDIGLQAGKIKHVIYIVKENRTYDQVLGDVPAGNGDPSLVLFGRNITPNQHALAERFVLLDNFYDSGEVSGDGWTWSTQAMANEYVIRNVPYGYSDRGRKFDYEGSNNSYPTGGFPAKGPDGKPLSQDPAFKNGAPAVPDVAEAPGGHIWDAVRKAGLAYRNYGFFYSNLVETKDKKVIIPDNYPASTGLQPGGRDLAGISDIDFRKFDMEYPDSDAPSLYYNRTKNNDFLWKLKSFGQSKAPSRFSEWNNEFQKMLAKDAAGDAVPNFMTIRFCTDHTVGLNPGGHSPKAHVADNDYAVGQLVEAVSNSPIWKSTAIFIIEDDAQNGPDHVDAHRSTCFVISPWIKVHSVDHTFHNTSSVLKTMELVLGLGPMCQYDAFASPIMNWNDRPDNNAPYTAILPPAEPFAQINPKINKATPISPEARLGKLSSEMDFDHADAAPADLLTEIIWKSVKGYESVMPKSPGASFIEPQAKKDDDD